MIFLLNVMSANYCHI